MKKTNITAILFITVVFTATACGKKQVQAASAPAYEQQLKTFNTTQEEDLGATKWTSGYSLGSNETRLELFKPHIENIGGGYVGVGSLQNMVLAAWAKSEWIWMMDFTNVVVLANKAHIGLIKNSATAEEFISHYQKGANAKAKAVLDKEYQGHKELNDIKKAYDMARETVRLRVNLLKRLGKEYNVQYWLYDKPQYDYIRKLAQEGRIQAVRGDLTATQTLQSISSTAKKMGVPIRILYPSNAEEYFGKTFDVVDGKKGYIPNITGLYTDQKGVVIRTVSVYRWKYPWAPGSEKAHPWGFDKGFHYNVQPLQDFKAYMARTDIKPGHLDLMAYSEVKGKTGLSIIKDAGKVPQDEKATETTTEKK